MLRHHPADLSCLRKLWFRPFRLSPVTASAFHTGVGEGERDQVSDIVGYQCLNLGVRTASCLITASTDIVGVTKSNIFANKMTQTVTPFWLTCVEALIVIDVCAGGHKQHKPAFRLSGR